MANSFPLEKILRGTGGALGGLGLVASAAANVVKVTELWTTRFFLMLAISWLFAMIALWPGAERRKAGFSAAPAGGGDTWKRHLPLAAVTLVAAGLGGWRAWVLYVPDGTPVDIIIDPIPSPSPSQDDKAGGKEPHSLLDLFEGAARAEKRKPKPVEPPAPAPPAIAAPTLIQLTLNDKKTSFVKDEEDDEHGVRRLVFKMSGEVAKAIQNGGCGRQFHYRAEAAREALERFVRSKRDGKYLAYVTSGSFEKLVNRHSQVVQAIVPQGQEWKGLAGNDYDLLLDWVVSCIGVRYPVFTLQLDNPSEEELVVKAVKYEVLAVEPLRGGEAGLSYPVTIYRIVIPAKPGTAGALPLVNPILRIGPHRRDQPFDLQAETDAAGAVSVVWKMAIETTHGTVETPPFRVEYPGRIGSPAR